MKENFTGIEDFIKDVAEIAGHTRDEISKLDGKVSDYISSRTTKEMCELYQDGFSFREILEVCVYPLFSDEGGTESERVYIKQYCQKYLPDKDSPNNLF